MTHFIQECIHGVVAGQCRCPATNKRVIIVPCPTKCGRQDHFPSRQDGKTLRYRWNLMLAEMDPDDRRRYLEGLLEGLEKV